MRKPYMLALSLTMASAIAALPACSSDSPASSTNDGKDVVRMEILDSGLATVIHGVAEQVNAYGKNGIDVKVESIKSGDSSVAIQQLVQGRADVAFVNTESVATLDSAYIAKGVPAPLKAVAATGNVSNIVLSKKINYAGPESLKGLTLGVSSLTSIHRTSLDYYLREHGTSEKALGIKFVAVGSDEMPSALASGQLDGFLHSEPTTTIALQKSNAQLAATIGGDVRSQPPNVFAVNATYLKSHRQTVKKLVDSLQAASSQFKSLPASQIAKIYAKYLKSSQSLGLAVYKQKDHYDPTLQSLRPSAQAYWKVSVPGMKERALVTDKMQQDDMFDFSFSR